MSDSKVTAAHLRRTAAVYCRQSTLIQVERNRESTLRQYDLVSLQELVAEKPSEGLVGFAELSLRPYAEDCRTSPVAFLEGWYVTPSMRRQGVGRALVRAAEEWGRAQGCREFGSDTQFDNSASIAAHLALGFDDAGALRSFRKDL